MLATYDANDNLLQRYEYSLGQTPTAFTQGTNRFYIITDQIGTPRVITDATGTVVKQIEYDAYGNVINDTNPAIDIPFGFAGGLKDNHTGLIRFGYRDFDPETGRWTARDPIGFAGGDTNLYGYVGGNPVMFIDPNGLEAQWSNMDALVHFLNEGGDVTLSEIGHFDTIRNSNVTTGVVERLGDQIREAAQTTAEGKAPGEYSFSYRFSNSYDYTGDKFFIGGSTLSGSYSGTVTVLEGGVFTYSGRNVFYYSDIFEDPWDLFDWVDGVNNIGGKPYNITGRWIEAFEGAGFCR
ncbi:MAG: RHS repeat-associated protein [Reinekea sp.]|uniref:RHS repeat-associated core domain-containing protein n=2 Tax=Reinekea sp. TaxID=1970455 RepID=UPI003988F70F